MPVIEVQFKLEKETKGALRYQEVDEKGEAIEQAWAKIGTLYVRKSAFERGKAWLQELRDRRRGRNQIARQNVRHQTARVHPATRRRSGRVAAHRAHTGVGADAPDYRIDGNCE